MLLSEEFVLSTDNSSMISDCSGVEEVFSIRLVGVEVANTCGVDDLGLVNWRDWYK